jgi:hypothetical protein
VNLGTAVDRVITEGGFDSTSTNTPRSIITAWVSTQINEALARSKFRKQMREIGPTIAGQSQYAVPSDVVDMRYAVIAGRIWRVVSMDDFIDLKVGLRSRRAGVPGVIAASFEADADAVIDLYPTPDQGAQTITAVVAVTVGDLTDETKELPLPLDVQSRIAIDGAIGLGHQRLEEDAESAAPYLQRFEEGVAMLSKRTNTRIGSGPGQIQIRRP